MFGGVYVGSQTLIGEQEAYFLTAGEMTEVSYMADETEPLSGYVSFKAPLDAAFTINYIEVTYNNTADGDRQLSWSTSEATATLGTEFQSPTLSGETSGVGYSSSNTAVALVDSEGNVNPVAEGSCVITAACPEDYPWKAAETSYRLTVRFELDGVGTDETITLTQAGTLKEKVADMESVRIRSIKVIGPINGADLAYLHTTTGRFTSLQAIDLSDVTLSPDETVYATRSERSDIGMGSTTWQYIMSNKNYEERHTTPTGLGGGVTTVKVYNTRLAGAFADMPNLKKAILPACLADLGEYTYSGCSSLLKASVPAATTTIPKGAFYNCEKLKSIDIPSTITSIDSAAFYRCAVTAADLKGVTHMGEYAFYEAGLTGTVNIASLRNIPQGAFRSCVSLTGVELSEQLDSVGMQAFDGTGLLSIRIPESCIYVAPCGFANNNIMSADIPSTLYRIGFDAFSGNPWYDNLKNNSDEIIYVGGAAYAINNKNGMLSTSTVVIKEGTLGIADRLFLSSNITGITLPSTIRYIGERAFAGCDKLVQFTMPADIEEIGERAFGYCSLLPDVTFGENIKSIGVDAFSGCTSLSQLKLNSNIETIGNSAFSACSGLVKVYYDVPNAQGKYIFRSCNGLESMLFGTNVRTIPDYFAEECASLLKVDFENMPETNFVESKMFMADDDNGLVIGTKAFSTCSELSTLVLPEYLTTIGENAFENNSLKTVRCYLRYPIDIENTGLNAKGKETTIYVAEDVVDIFRQEIHWNQCTLKEMIVTAIDGINNDNDNSNALRYYNVNGQRVDSNARGLIITSDGRKIYK